MGIGFKQECYEKEQLASHYTLRSGGGWSGATFDSETRPSASTIGAEHVVGSRKGTRSLQANQEAFSWKSIFRRKPYSQPINAPMRRMTSAGSEHEDFNNLLLNRDTMRFTDMNNFLRGKDRQASAV